MTKIDRLEKILLKTQSPMSRAEMAKAIGVSERSLSTQIHTLRERHQHTLLHIKVGKATHYRIDKTVGKPNRQSALGLPSDLWRGWVNPATGIVPAKLGL